MRFDDMTVLVTGGTSGVGRATATAFADRGAAVVITGRDERRGAQVVAEIAETGGTARFVRADLRSQDEVQQLVQATGQVDVLVNDAGYWELGPTHETTEAGFDAMFDVNVKGPFFLAAAYAPLMASRGGGAIVNVSTMVAAQGAAGMAAYGASKAALEALTRSWAAEYGSRKVRVNAVALGPTRTPVTATMGPMLDTLAAAAPLGRPAEPSEIAAAIVYLAGDESSFITGAVVPVDGGRTATL
jgi:NAD(P)-dependent dehydrogenase (short-subunit alcohol dehydrogenase family)